MEFQQQEIKNIDDDISEHALIEAAYRVDFLEIIYEILNNIDYDNYYKQEAKRPS